MGRELRRVALDFKDYEVNKPYQGYINPHEFQECKCCDGSGNSREYRILHDKWYGSHDYNYQPNPYCSDAQYNANAWQYNLDKNDIAVLIEAKRIDFDTVNGGKIPTPLQMKELVLRGHLGFFSTNGYVVIKAKLERLGLSSKCPNCNGTGEDWDSEEKKVLYHNWEKIEPPQGDGFQLWSTTSDKPNSPVFDTLEKLCVYLVENDVSIFAYDTLTYEEWYETLSKDVIVYKTEIGTFI